MDSITPYPKNESKLIKANHMNYIEQRIIDICELLRRSNIMSINYTPHKWKNGEYIKAEYMNNIENTIEYIINEITNLLPDNLSEFTTSSNQIIRGTRSNTISVQGAIPNNLIQYYTPILNNSTLYKQNPNFSKNANTYTTINCSFPQNEEFLMESKLYNLNLKNFLGEITIHNCFTNIYYPIYFSKEPADKVIDRFSSEEIVNYFINGNIYPNSSSSCLIERFLLSEFNPQSFIFTYPVNEFKTFLLLFPNALYDKYNIDYSLTNGSLINPRRPDIITRIKLGNPDHLEVGDELDEEEWYPGGIIEKYGQDLYVCHDIICEPIDNNTLTITFSPKTN